MDPGASDTTKAAIADLVARFGVSADDISVVRSEAVTWRDSSLGCPEDGMGYAQVLVDGWLVVLQANGTTYEYHSGSSPSGSAGAPTYCADPQEPLPGSGAA